MLGYTHVKGNTLEQLLRIPECIVNYSQQTEATIFIAGGVGIASLLIMVFYSKIRNRYFQLIPAPMWIVLLTIGMSYYYELVLKSQQPIAENLLIQIPKNVVTELAQPNFSKILDCTSLGMPTL